MLSDNTTTMNSETENSLKVDVPKRTDSGRSRQPVLSPHKTDTFLFLASTRSEGGDLLSLRRRLEFQSKRGRVLSLDPGARVPSRFLPSRFLGGSCKQTG